MLSSCVHKSKSNQPLVQATVQTDPYTFDRSLNPTEATSAAKDSTSVKRLATSAIFSSPLHRCQSCFHPTTFHLTYPVRRTRHASLIHPTQFVLIKLKAHTATSIVASESSPSCSLPGSGNRVQMSASTTAGSSETRSNEITFRPFGINARPSAASPHPRSTIAVLGGYDERAEM